MLPIGEELDLKGALNLDLTFHVADKDRERVSFFSVASEHWKTFASIRNVDLCVYGNVNSQWVGNLQGTALNVLMFASAGSVRRLECSILCTLFYNLFSVGCTLHW